MADTKKSIPLLELPVRVIYPPKRPNAPTQPDVENNCWSFKSVIDGAVILALVTSGSAILLWIVSTVGPALQRRGDAVLMRDSLIVELHKPVQVELHNYATRLKFEKGVVRLEANTPPDIDMSYKLVVPKGPTGTARLYEMNSDKHYDVIDYDVEM